jgi:sodium/bile acid cotransporter 7
MNSYFLPVGLVLALAAAMLEPFPGSMLQQMGLVPWMVVTIFLVNGYQVNLKQFPHGGKLLPATVVGVLISLLISPLLGLAIVSVVTLPVGIALGLVVMATVPPTLSSGIVMTQLAGGNVAKALFLTIVLNLIGVFSIPFMLQLTLGSAGLVALSAWPILKQLLLWVLAPFVIGALLQPALRISPRHWLLRYLPQCCVIGTVWMSASASSDTLKGLDMMLLLLVTIGSLGIHGGLMLLCWLSRFLYRPRRSEWVALLFTASQKTLPIALGVLAIMDRSVGSALVACIIFHFVQLFVDSIIASRMGRDKGLLDSAL